MRTRPRARSRSSPPRRSARSSRRSDEGPHAARGVDVRVRGRHGGRSRATAPPRPRDRCRPVLRRLDGALAGAQPDRHAGAALRARAVAARDRRPRAPAPARRRGPRPLATGCRACAVRPDAARLQAGQERRAALVLRRRSRSRPVRLRRRGQPPARARAAREGGPAVSGGVECGERISGERRVRADVCVIGSGAGGAPVAKELAEGGGRVVTLEEGRHFTTDDFDARPRNMTALLYRDAGQVATLGNVPIVLPLGQTVGGTTTVNSGTCFRTPAPVLDMWRRDYGLEELSAEALDPFFRRVERIVNVTQVPADIAGKNAEVVKRGADALGWSGDFVYRNVRGCVGSGICNFGCPTSAKQHTGVTYVPRAWEAGATTYSGCRAERIE